jgi:hypothetical protein
MVKLVSEALWAGDSVVSEWRKLPVWTLEDRADRMPHGILP